MGDEYRPPDVRKGRRDVILIEELALRLRKRRLAARFSQDDDLVLGNGVGKTLGYTRLLRAFSDASESAGLRGVTPHTYADPVVKPTLARFRCSRQLAPGGCRHIHRSSRNLRSGSGGW
jgi:hypothetical protein